ncbi:MAG: Ig-like domain-containing protein, partial [Gammaproteobacteria bacterium]
VTPPGGDFGRYKLRAAVKDEGSGQVLASRDYAAAAHLVAELDGSLMQAGRPYLATLSLIDQSSGGAVSTYPAYRVSKVPGTARQSMNISFDAKNRVLLKGKPRFILGVYDSGGGYSTLDSYWENALWSATGSRRMDGLRINFYLNYWMGEAPADAMKALMSNLQKRGVMYLQTGNCFDKIPAGSNFKINNSDGYVQDIGAHAGSAGYYTIDECRSELVPGAFSQYVRLRQLDPDSATFAALFGNSDIALWRDAADLLSSDPYPMFAAEPSGGYNHKQVADWTAETREAVKDARPFLTVLQFFKFTSKGRWPTRQEMRNHAYMAIVEGARGLWWWSIGNGNGALAALCSDWCAERTSHMNDLKAVVGELADLEPVLLADDARGALTGNSNSSAIKTKVKLVNGKGYVFAYNYTTQNVTATLTWNTAPGTVTVSAENRTLAPSGNSFTDSFAPYQAHVYVLDTAGSGGSGSGGTTNPPPGGGSLTVAFANPQDGATVSGTATTTMSADGGSGYTFRLAVDGTTVYTGANNSFSWNTSAVANGSHTLTATVTDSGGKSGSASIGVNVSNTTSPPPAGGLKAIFTSPAEGATVSGTQVSVNLWVEGQSGSSNTFSLSVDSQSLGSRTTSGTHVTIAWDSTKVPDGVHTLTATVRDAAGNTGTASRTVTTKNGVGGTSLTASITAPAANATVSATTTVSMAVSGAAAG